VLQGHNEKNATELDTTKCWQRQRVAGKKRKYACKKCEHYMQYIKISLISKVCTSFHTCLIIPLTGKMITAE
jgi:hypothetical protein